MVEKRASLAERYPEIAAQWHPTKNGGFRPEEISSGSGKKVWWLCPKCGHEWEAIIGNRTGKGSGCPACAGRVRRVNDQSMSERFPELAREFLPELNDGIAFDDLRPSSKVRVTWRCVDCGHKWETFLSSRTTTGSGCPECRRQKKIRARGSLSEEYPEVALEWHPVKNGTLTPHDVLPKSGKRVWWRCSRCGFEWDAVIAKRTASGTGCPECSRMRSRLPKPLYERGYPMRIGVTMDASDGTVFSGLGRCDSINVYSVDDGELGTCEEFNVKGLRRQGIMKLLKEQKVTHFVTGELGENAMESLRPMGVIVYHDVTGDALEAIEAVLSGDVPGRLMGANNSGIIG